MVQRAERQPESRDELIQRVAALSAEKLALLDRRLRGDLPRSSQQVVDHNGSTPHPAADQRKSRGAAETIEAVQQDPAVAGNEVHAKAVSVSSIPAGTVWPHLDRISDDDVSSLLIHLTPEPNGKPALSEPLPLGAQRLKDSQFEPIPRLSRGRERDLELKINQLSKEAVDALLSMLLDTPEAQQTLSSIAPDAARTGIHDQDLEAMLTAVSETKRPSSVAASPLKSSFQRTSPLLHKRFELVYLTYVRTVQEASMKAQRWIEEEQFNLNWSIYEASVAGTEPSVPAELQIRHAQTVQLIQRETRDSIHSAFLSYLETMRETWLQADIENLDPGLLAAISQTMSLAATFAIGNY